MARHDEPTRSRVAVSRDEQERLDEPTASSQTTVMVPYRAAVMSQTFSMLDGKRSFDDQGGSYHAPARPRPAERPRCSPRASAIATTPNSF